VGKELKRLKRRKETSAKLEALQEQAATTLVVHYSCESFYDKTDGKTPRVTSLAVRNLASGQTDSFSIHQIAEERHVPFDEITNHYDDLERQMLERFFEFARTRQHCNWIHWNMRDVNYGFAAIEHRTRVLGAAPIQISEDRKFDLARALIDLFGVSYIGHPRMENILQKNRITAKDFMTGKQEADAFENKEFVKLHQSTLRKVDCLANIFDRTLKGELKTNATWAQRNGLSVGAIGEWAKEYWLITTLIACGGLLTLVLRAHDIWKLLTGP
jgi:hypothetical protein